MRIRAIHTIARKEFEGYLNTPLGYIFMTVFLLTSFFLFFRDFFLLGQSTLRLFFQNLPWLYLILLPAITMRLWSEERKMGTEELLLTAPVTPLEVVLGKFLASVELLSLTLLLSGILPALLFFVGQPDWGAILGGYIGALLLGASTLAVGLFVSSLTDSQIVAFIVTVLILAIFFFIGEGVFLRTAPGSLVPLMSYLSLDLHFKSLLRGVFDTRDLFFYASFIFLFLYWNVLSLTHRKWR